MESLKWVCGGPLVAVLLLFKAIYVGFFFYYLGSKHNEGQAKTSRYEWVYDHASRTLLSNPSVHV